MGSVNFRRCKMKVFLASLAILLFIGCSKESPKEEAAEFKPPEDGRITMERAQVYVQASNYLMEAIKKHEIDMEGFAERYKLSEDLSELSDSTYCDRHPEVVRAWERLQARWREYELEAYKKAGISEDEFNWIGGALADTVNKDIQTWVQEELRETL